MQTAGLPPLLPFANSNVLCITALPAGWKITLSDTPRNPITVTDRMINKHPGQSPSCHFPAETASAAKATSRNEVFYSGLIETGLTSSDSQKRAGIQDRFSCLFSRPLWKFFGSSHPPRHHQTPDLGLWNVKNEANFRDCNLTGAGICLIYLIKHHVLTSCCVASLASLLNKHREV